MKRPYCTINGIKYKLRLVTGVLRFENSNPTRPDLNSLWASYQNGTTGINELFEYYSRSGSSLSLMIENFSKYNDRLNKDDVKKFRVYK